MILNEQIIEKKIIDHGLLLIAMHEKDPCTYLTACIFELCLIADMLGICASADGFREELELLHASLPKKPEDWEDF